MITIAGHTDDPEKYNRGVVECKMSLGSGCVTTWACTKCGALNSDSLCLCMGIFDCLECGHENGNRVEIDEPTVTAAIDWSLKYDSFGMWAMTYQDRSFERGDGI